MGMVSSFATNDQSLSRTFSTRDNDANDYFHSSSYGEAQNDGRIGVGARGKTVAERKAIDQSRKFVRGYENASLSSQISMSRERAMKMYADERASRNIGDAGSINLRGEPTENTTENSTTNRNSQREKQKDKNSKQGDNKTDRPNGYGYSTNEDSRYRTDQKEGKLGEQNIAHGYGYSQNTPGQNIPTRNYGTAPGQLFKKSSLGYFSDGSVGQGFEKKFEPNFGRSVETEYGGGQGYTSGRGYSEGQSYMGGQNYAGGRGYVGGQSYTGSTGRVGSTGGQGYTGSQNYGRGQGYSSGGRGYNSSGVAGGRQQSADRYMSLGGYHRTNYGNAGGGGNTGGAGS